MHAAARAQQDKRIKVDLKAKRLKVDLFSTVDTVWIAMCLGANTLYTVQGTRCRKLWTNPNSSTPSGEFASKGFAWVEHRLLVCMIPITAITSRGHSKSRATPRFKTAR